MGYLTADFNFNNDCPLLCVYLQESHNLSPVSYSNRCVCFRGAVWMRFMLPAASHEAKLHLRRSNGLVCVRVFSGDSKWSPSVPIEGVNHAPGSGSVLAWMFRPQHRWVSFMRCLVAAERTCECSSFTSLFWTLEGVFLMVMFRETDDIMLPPGIVKHFIVFSLCCVWWHSWIEAGAAINNRSAD